MDTDPEDAAISMDILVKAVGEINTKRFIAYMIRQQGIVLWKDVNCLKI